MQEVSLVSPAPAILLPMGVAISHCGLEIAGRPSLEDCVLLARDVIGVADRVDVIARFVLGDLLCWSEARHGEHYAAFEAATGLSYQSLADLKYVASRVEISRRREKLSVAHHREVASLSPEMQDQWLSHAEEGKVSAKSLREQIGAWRAEEKVLEERRQRALSQSDPIQVPPPDDAPIIGKRPEPSAKSAAPSTAPYSPSAASPSPNAAEIALSKVRASEPIEPISRTLTRPAPELRNTEGALAWHGPIYRAYVNYEADGKPGTMIYEIEEVPTDAGSAFEIRSELTEFGRRATLAMAKARVSELAAEALAKIGGGAR